MTMIFPFKLWIFRFHVSFPVCSHQPGTCASPLTTTGGEADWYAMPVQPSFVQGTADNCWPQDEQDTWALKASLRSIKQYLHSNSIQRIVKHSYKSGCSVPNTSKFKPNFHTHGPISTSIISWRFAQTCLPCKVSRFCGLVRWILKYFPTTTWYLKKSWRVAKQRMERDAGRGW